MENKQRESRWNKDISSSPEAGAVSSATPCWVVKHPLQPHTGLSGLEEHYRLWASLVWRKWVTSLLPEEWKQREVLSSSSWYPVIRCTGMVQSCTRGDWTWGIISLSRVLWNTARGFLERESISQPVSVQETFGQCPWHVYGHPWIVQAAGLDDPCRVLPTENTLF